MRLVGVGMFILGIIFIYSQFRQKKEDLSGEKEGVGLAPSRVKMQRSKRISGVSVQKEQDEYIKPETQGIVTRIMLSLSTRAKKVSYLTFPIIGALIIDAVIIYNIKTGQGLDLKSWDIITVMLGASLIIYNFVPENLGMTRDFVVFFLAILFIILVFPQVLYGFFVGEQASARYTQILLADPVAWLLNIFGVDAHTYIDEYTYLGQQRATAIIAWGPGLEDRVGITEACSGIYTTSIFISAFVTYILVEYQKINFKVIIILIIGVFTSYLANILRMTIITYIGYLYDTDALLAAHANAGWLIFLAWIIPFWFLVFKYLIKEEDEPKKTSTRVTGS